MSIQLRDGSTTEDRRLDRIKFLDPRSRGFAIQERVGTVPLKSKVWRLWRKFYGDQGEEGACVEFGILHVLATLPVAQALAVLQLIRREHRIYWPAQRIDPWEGGSYPGASPVYEGTSEVAGLKIARDLGFFTEFTWAFGIDQALSGLIAHGAGNLALDWTEGMSKPRPNGLITADGSVMGGHDVALIGVLLGHKLKGEPSRDLAVIAQSWGLDHGDRGRVYLPLEDLDKQLRAGGTCAFVHGEKRLELHNLAA